jgi:hypothetical protein
VASYGTDSFRSTHYARTLLPYSFSDANCESKDLRSDGEGHRNTDQPRGLREPCSIQYRSEVNTSAETRAMAALQRVTVLLRRRMVTNSCTRDQRVDPRHVLRGEALPVTTVAESGQEGHESFLAFLCLCFSLDRCSNVATL